MNIEARLTLAGVLGGFLACLRAAQKAGNPPSAYAVEWVDKVLRHAIKQGYFDDLLHLVKLSVDEKLPEVMAAAAREQK